LQLSRGDVVALIGVNGTEPGPQPEIDGSDHVDYEAKVFHTAGQRLAEGQTEAGPRSHHNRAAGRAAGRAARARRIAAIRSSNTSSIECIK